MVFEVDKLGIATRIDPAPEADSELRVVIDRMSAQIKCTLNCISATYSEVRKDPEAFENYRTAVNERILDILDLCTSEVYMQLTKHEQKQIELLKSRFKKDFGEKVTILAELLTYLDSRYVFDANLIAMQTEDELKPHRQFLAIYIALLETFKNEPTLENLFEVKTLVTAYTNLSLPSVKVLSLTEAFDHFFAHNFFMMGIEGNKCVDLSEILRIIKHAGSALNETRAQDPELN